MPSVSKAQNAAMHSAAQGKSTLGIPKAVGKEFDAATRGKKVSAMPAHMARRKMHKMMAKAK